MLSEVLVEIGETILSFFIFFTSDNTFF